MEPQEIAAFLNSGDYVFLRAWLFRHREWYSYNQLIQWATEPLPKEFKSMRRVMTRHAAKILEMVYGEEMPAKKRARHVYLLMRAVDKLALLVRRWDESKKRSALLREELGCGVLEYIWRRQID